MREYLHSRMPAANEHALVYHGHGVTFDTMRSELPYRPQEQTVSQVLDDFAKYYQNLEEQRDDVAEAGKRRILSVLDDSQKQRFYELFKETLHHNAQA